MVIVAVSLAAFLAMAAVSINIAYIQLARTEMRAATDAAAKAAAESLARQDSVTAATTAAIENAATNRVGGNQLSLSADDIAIGSAARQSDGSWLFTEGAQPFSAVRVTAAAPVQLFFPGVTGVGSTTPNVISTAAFSEHEVCLVLDRSHSMCFDMSGVDWVYPTGTPAAPPDPVIYPPHDSLSRWAALEGAVALFLSTVSNTQSTQRVALVTWGSEIGLDTYEGGLTGRTFVAAEVDQQLGQDYSAIESAVQARGQDVMLGGTNLSAGIDLGTSVLTGPGSRSYAKKSMIVMTDGAWNEGRRSCRSGPRRQSSGNYRACDYLSQPSESTRHAGRCERHRR